MPTTPRPSCDTTATTAGAGTNSMVRLNYFNGRFLTAEALRLEQTYWDTRARLAAQVHPAGIAWGLGVTHVATAFTLAPGLAFDGLGTPILVESPVDFTLGDLLSAFQLAPLTLQTTRGTSFSDARCVAPSSGVTGSAAVTPGPYLLVLEPTETACGEAKVYGTTCNTPTALCETNGWKAGFRVSLVALPNAPAVSANAGEARGTISAWYFDTLENNLGVRWAAPFPDDTSCDGPGPSGRYASPVPLGLVQLGAGGAMVFFDPWIPRRPIVSTATGTWATTALGAPTPAAAVARIHQFQCQLAEGSQTGNLYQRGFRHIPPFGFLPVDVSDVGNGEDALDLAFGSIRKLDAAEKQAKAYFCDTNVYTRCLVALHDDDLFEDMGDVFYKDPIFLTERACVPFPDLHDPCLDKKSLGLLVLNWLLAPRGLTVSALVNRETEFVKLIVPLQGTVRADPVDDPCVTTTPSASAKSKDYSSTTARRLAALFGASADEWVPRQFVVYVKQRFVWMDVVFRIAEALSDLACWLGPIVARHVGTAEGQDQILGVGQPLAQSFQVPKKSEVVSAPPANVKVGAYTEVQGGEIAQVQSAPPGAYVDTAGLRGILEQRPPRAVGYLRSAWGELWSVQMVREGIVRGAAEMDGLRDPQNWAKYQAYVKAEGRDAAIDRMIVDERVGGWGVIKGLALVLRGTQMNDFEEQVSLAATEREKCKPDEGQPEPVPTLTCEAIEKSTVLEKAYWVRALCSCELDAGKYPRFNATLSPKFVEIFGQSKASELPPAGTMTDEMTVAQALLEQGHDDLRKALFDWLTDPNGNRLDVCNCIRTLAGQLEGKYDSGREVYLAWVARFPQVGETQLSCVTRWLPAAQIQALKAWLETQAPSA